MGGDLHIDEIVAFLRSRVPFQVDLAVVCGSGLSELTNIIQNPIAVPYSDIPYFPRSTVAGHGNQLVFGDLGGKKVVAMKGRFHFYEGYHPALVTIGARVFAALGAKVFLVTNAAGGVNPAFNVGDVMIMEDHISFPCLSGAHPLVGHNDERFGPRFPAVTNAYSAEMQTVVVKAAEKLGLSSFIRRGTYVGVSGPSYETRHEIGMMRLLGGDSVGMSTVPEVVVAAHCGMKVLGLSLITNRCVAPGDDIVAPTHEEVLAATEARKKDLQALVAEVIANIQTAGIAPTKAEASFAGVAPAGLLTKARYAVMGVPAAGGSGSAAHCPFVLASGYALAAGAVLGAALLAAKLAKGK